MLGDQVRQQSLAGDLVIELHPRQHEALPHIVDEFGQQHRGYLVAVVLGAETLIADVEPLLGAEQRLEEQVAVVIATGAIPRRPATAIRSNPMGGRVRG